MASTIITNSLFLPKPLFTKTSLRFNNNTSFICFSQRSNPLNPKWPNRPLNPIILVSLLPPILQTIRVLASWAPQFQGFDSFGGALMSVTANAKVRMSPIVAQLAGNRTFVSGMFAWMAAQSMKVVLNFFVERKWDWKVMCASGGMPSSHSALCTALTTSVGICHGMADSLFAVCLGFSLVVMYDAIGVRRHAGMQAEVLNIVVEYLFQGHPISQKKLKELLGHTPSQVLAGALLGIVVACVCCQSSLVVA